MSKKNSENKNKEPDFLYDYGKTTIYKKQYAKNIIPDGFIKMPFKSSDNTANPSLIISSSNTKCETTNLYIYRNVHNIKESTETYDGELIIEHEPITNSYEKFYVCLLLKTDSGVKKTNVLDKIINDTMETSEVLNLNELIPGKSEYIMNKTSNVIIFTKPIHILSSFEKFKKIGDASEKLFDYSEKNFAKSVGEKGTSNYEGFLGTKIIEGLDQYMECVPDDGTPSDTTRLTTTIDSNFEKIAGENTALNMVLTIFCLGIAILFGSFFVPPLYELTVIRAITNWANNTNNNAASNLKGFDILIVIWAIFTSISILLGFIRLEETSGTLFGSTFFFIIMLSFIIIFFYKMRSPADYCLSDDNFFEIETNMTFAMQFLKTPFKNWGSLIFMLLFLGVFLIAIPTLGEYSVFNKNKTQSLAISGVISTLTIAFGLPIIFILMYIYSD